MKTYFDDITDFIFVEDRPQKSEVLFIPGSGYGELAVEAARLWKEGYAEYLVVSGRYSVLKKGFDGAISPKEYVHGSFETEADFLAQVLQDHGVPQKAILLEREAAFTYENAIKSRELLSRAEILVESAASKEKENGDRAKKAILVCQAFHARRSLMYYQLVFPEVDFCVCPAKTQGITRENWHRDAKKIDVVLGELARCGTQFGDIMKGTDRIWKRREII
ncbi:MAG: YdcF family protein [Eubacteriales bacterium]|nr:YdcF family protein [Eubacteriales bacterium]